MNTLGIIPARGGSKGIPRKNIRSLNGKPLIAYTIEASLKSRRLTRFITTTDSDEIYHVASSLGCEVLKRPSDLALDQSPMVPVALHALETLESNHSSYDAVILLQPTCPLRTSEDIDRALELLESSGAPAVIGVYRVWDQHPGRMYRIESTRLTPYDPLLEMKNRQDLPPVYHRNGLIYAVRTEILKEKKTFFPDQSLPMEMSRALSVNIDEEVDFLFADFLLKTGYDSNSKP